MFASPRRMAIIAGLCFFIGSVAAAIEVNLAAWLFGVIGMAASAIAWWRAPE